MQLNITEQRKLWWSISIGLALVGTIAMGISFSRFSSPVALGLDFSGGTRLQLELDCTINGNCDTRIELNEARAALNELDLAADIQVIGENKTGVAIRTANLNVEQRTALEQALADQLGTFDTRKTQIDTVGPTVGQQLLSAGLLSLIVASAGIVAYLSLRFQLDYAIFAIIALLHDVWITAGVFSILGLTAGFEADSLFMVALLTIVGFSVNDTVVIYDRVRETGKANPELTPNQIVDQAVNQTLGRSINTTLTTVLPLLAIFIFGGATLKDFALILIVGFLLGAYSSIFIASSLLAVWRNKTGDPFGADIVEPPSSDAVV
ncbi:MAG: protein translocase subunit SecF [Coleofasciculaceae cyanobacterium RL_1_1]|nr:protein translocase subunit SecF [Coleofasciculaceae cyanobacterium RL_1_1]